MEALNIYSKSQNSTIQCNKAIDGSFLCIYTIQALAIFIGNVFTCAVFLSKRRLREVFMNVFLISLAVSDFLVSVLIIPGYTVFCSSCVTSLFGKRETACIVFDAIKDFIFLANIFNILAITFDRYIAVIKPFHYATAMTSTRVTGILIFSWLLPLPFSCMKQVFLTISPTIFQDKLGRAIYDNSVVFVCVVLPMFIIVVVNTMITKAIRKQMARINHHGNMLMSYKVREQSVILGEGSRDGSVVSRVNSGGSNRISSVRDIPNLDDSRNLNDVSLQSCEEDDTIFNLKTSRDMASAVTSCAQQSRENNEVEISSDITMEQLQKMAHNGDEVEYTLVNNIFENLNVLIPRIRILNPARQPEMMTQKSPENTSYDHVNRDIMTRDTSQIQGNCGCDNHVMESNSLDDVQSNSLDIKHDNVDSMSENVDLTQTEGIGKKDKFNAEKKCDKNVIEIRHFVKMIERQENFPEDISHTHGSQIIDEDKKQLQLKNIEQGSEGLEKANKKYNGNYEYGFENLLTNKAIQLYKNAADVPSEHINEVQDFEDCVIAEHEQIYSTLQDVANSLEISESHSNSNTRTTEEENCEKDEDAEVTIHIPRRKFGSASPPIGITNYSFLEQNENYTVTKTSDNFKTESGNEFIANKDCGIEQGELPSRAIRECNINEGFTRDEEFKNSTKNLKKDQDVAYEYEKDVQPVRENGVLGADEETSEAVIHAMYNGGFIPDDNEQSKGNDFEMVSGDKKYGKEIEENENAEISSEIWEMFSSESGQALATTGTEYKSNSFANFQESQSSRDLTHKRNEVLHGEYDNTAEDFSEEVQNINSDDTKEDFLGKSNGIAIGSNDESQKTNIYTKDAKFKNNPTKNKPKSSSEKNAMSKTETNRPKTFAHKPIKTSNNKDSSKSSRSLTHRLRKISREIKETNGTLCCLVVCLIFIICWIPRCLLNFFKLFSEQGVSDDYLLEKISLLFLFFQSLTNPLVYSFYRRDFRKAAKDLIRKVG